MSFYRFKIQLDLIYSISSFVLKWMLFTLYEVIVHFWYKTFRSFLRPLRERSLYGWIWLFTEAIQIEFCKKVRKYVCAGVGKMKRRIKSKKPNWLVWQQLQQHRPPWRYWFIFFRNIFTTADATNDSFEQKYETILYYGTTAHVPENLIWSHNTNIF